MTYDIEKFKDGKLYQPLITDSRFFDDYDDRYLYQGVRFGCGSRLRAIYAHMSERINGLHRVLDVGCNIGFFCHALQGKQGIDCTGVDNNDHGKVHGQRDVLDTARQLSKIYKRRPVFLKHDFSDLVTFKPHDSVLCLSIFHHILTQAKQRGLNVSEVATSSLQMLFELANKTLYFEIDTSLPAANEAGFSSENLLHKIESTLNIEPELLYSSHVFGGQRFLLALNRL